MKKSDCQHKEVDKKKKNQIYSLSCFLLLKIEFFIKYYGFPSLRSYEILTTCPPTYVHNL